jgi:hypothetical protein
MDLKSQQNELKTILKPVVPSLIALPFRRSPRILLGTLHCTKAGAKSAENRNLRIFNAELVR